jgi:hypothetical protein
MEGTVSALASVVASICGADVPENLNAGQVCDSTKVSDHHAIVPKQLPIGNLLVLGRFMPPWRIPFPRLTG